MPITQYNRIKEHIDGQKVLDVGVVDHSYEQRHITGWTHEFIDNDAREVLGIDILEEEIEKLQDEGYNVIVADAQTFDLEEKFDVIFAGELIEHLSNPGQFLDTAKKHLHAGGKLLLTTPNALALKYSLFNFQPDGFVPNEEHTAWYCQHTIETLLGRHGFEIEEQGFYELHADRTNTSVKLNFWLAFTSLFPPRFRNQLFVVARPKQ